MESISPDERYTMTRKKVARLCAQNRMEEAREEWTRFLDSAFNYQTWDIVRKYAETCISQLPDHFKGYLAAGIACMNLQEYPSAFTHFSKTLDICPGHVIALHHMSEVLYGLDRYEEALQCAEMVGKYDPLRPEYIQLAVNNLVMLGRYQESSDLIEAGLRVHPGNCTLILGKAMIKNILGDLKGALEIFTKAEQIAREEPLSAALITNLILIHLNRGDMLASNNDKPGGDNEKELGKVMIELEKAKISEYRSN